MSEQPIIRTEEKHELQVQMPQDVHHGVYANQMVISHTPEEFILDFILATPPVGVVQARVLVSPKHAKRILRTLRENLGRYEAIYGIVDEDETIRSAPQGYAPH